MKRLFAAVRINPGESYLKSFRIIRSGLRSEAIKWVEEHNIHITIKFFGETEERLIPGISESLAGVAQNTDPLNFCLSGLGIFGSSYQPRVLWTGIVPHEQLSSLMKRTQKEMEQHGFESDRQNIVPHLTLGRIKFLKDKELFRKSLEAGKNIRSEPMILQECILFESILRKEGPEYIILEKFPFGK